MPQKQTVRSLIVLSLSTILFIAGPTLAASEELPSQEYRFILSCKGVDLMTTIYQENYGRFWPMESLFCFSITDHGGKYTRDAQDLLLVGQRFKVEYIDMTSWTSSPISTAGCKDKLTDEIRDMGKRPKVRKCQLGSNVWFQSRVNYLR